MKKRLVICSTCLLLLGGLTAYQTTADYVAELTTTNVVTTGNVEIELIEEYLDEFGETVVFDSTLTHEVVPGDSYSKIPYITNTGSESCYVRIYLATEATLGDEVLTADELQFDINDVNWVAEDDTSVSGWYRYDGVLESGQSTEPLFTEVAFALSMGNDYIGYAIDVNLQAQGVQYEYNELEDGETILDVTGWPASDRN
ncbi:MAG: hypothetical protein R3Y09_11430 [Clostridia bacterium]